MGKHHRRFFSVQKLLIVDRYKTLHLSAMGAAIPHLLQLTLALPPILPFSPDEIHTEVQTGTVEVQDEIIPEDEDEDISYQTRGKSSLKVVIKIGSGDDEPAGGIEKTAVTGKRKRSGKRKPGGEKGKGKMREDPSEPIVIQEPEQDDMDVA
jgi:ribonuclease P/MRP protein subunit RPP20